MIYYIFAIFLPIIIIFLYLSFKYLKLKLAEKNNFSIFIEDTTKEISENFEDFVKSSKEDIKEVENSLEHAKEIIFNSFYLIYKNSVFYTKRLANIILHFLVIFLKYFRDYTDIIYTKARNFFLYTAVKEKDSVSLFWKHLKEYKKEADKEKSE